MALRNGGLSTLRITKPRRSAISRPTAPKIQRLTEAEVVGGTIQGKKASAPEMVAATILEKYDKKYAFRYQIPVVEGIYGLRGQKEVDFMVFDGDLQPIQVDDTTFIHHTPQQIADDNESDIMVNKFSKEYGGRMVIRIDANKLINVSMADSTMKQLGII
jgi:hypothetical protein